MTTDFTEGEEARAEPATGASRRPVTDPVARSVPSRTADTEEGAVTASPPGSASAFFRRHRLPLLLALVAACLYAVSILYILYGRGQIA